MSNTAVFFNRDGTLIRDHGYLNHPDQVELLDGAAEAIKELQLLGYKAVVVSNQPGVARGIVTEEMLEQIHGRLGELLARKGASLDGIYYCPYHPDGAVPQYRKDSDCRKPGPGMLLAASLAMDIDLPRSWMVGNEHSDVEAGAAAGCRTILISPAHTDQTAAAGPDHMAVNMREAVNIIKKYHRSPLENRAMTPFAVKNDPEAAGLPECLARHETIVEADADVAPPVDEAPSPRATTEQLLTDVLEQLKRMHKSETFDEFSLLRLLAGIVQVFVPFCLLIALWLLMSSNGQNGNILVALGFAAVLQLMALTFYIMNGPR